MYLQTHFPKISPLFFVFICFLLSACGNQGKEEEKKDFQKIISPSERWDSSFGWAINRSDDYIIVSAWGEPKDALGKDSLFGAGAAYIFKKEGEEWKQVQKLFSADRVKMAWFGQSVAISEEYAFVGSQQEHNNALGEDSLNMAGAVYVFKKEGQQWKQVQKLVASDRKRFARFGNSISLSGDYAFIGAPLETKDASNQNEVFKAGAVYVFKNVGGRWKEVDKLVSSDRQDADGVGNAIKFVDDYVFIGASSDDDKLHEPDVLRSSVYVFEKEGDTWKERQKLIASDRVMHTSFGHSFDVENKYVIVGAPHEERDTKGKNNLKTAGAAYVFKKEGGEWKEVQKLVASDREEDAQFGRSVAILGDYILVGAFKESKNAEGKISTVAAGAVYVFKREGERWKEVKKIVPSDRRRVAHFGASIQAFQDITFIGAQGEGSVYIYETEELLKTAQ